MKKYGYDIDATHQAIIFEIGSEASDRTGLHDPNTPGMVIGSSEWGWISQDNARRICAALEFFSETSTEEIERVARDRFPQRSHDKI